MAEDDLGKRIAEAQKAHEQSKGDGSRMAGSGKGMGVGFKMASEFIASVFVGAALGWGLDQLLHTTPWMLIVWLLLGFAAGIVNVVRVARDYPSGAQGAEGSSEPDKGQEGG